MNTKKNRHSYLHFKNGKILKNRVVVPPMASGTADVQGHAKQETIDHYKKLTQSGASLVMVEYTYVNLSGRSEEFQLGIHTDEHISGLKKITSVIHEQHAMAGIQLTHAGGKSSRDMTDGTLPGPSALVVPVKDQEMEMMDALTIKEISHFKNGFIEAANRAVKAGFDLIEFHAAHGYGLNQWLSPITNKREDIYGGNIKNNLRILNEIIIEVKKNHPEILIAVRMPGQDFIPGGLTTEDGIYIAQTLEIIGVDILDVSSGIGGWRRPRDRTQEGYLVPEASVIQRAVGIPVIGVGGIETESFVDELIGSEKISLAAIGRAILSGQFKLSPPSCIVNFS